jgi:hypothetical protein
MIQEISCWAHTIATNAPSTPSCTESAMTTGGVDVFCGVWAAVAFVLWLNFRGNERRLDGDDMGFCVLISLLLTGIVFIALMALLAAFGHIPGIAVRIAVTLVGIVLLHTFGHKLHLPRAKHALEMLNVTATLRRRKERAERELEAVQATLERERALLQADPYGRLGLAEVERITAPAP